MRIELENRLTALALGINRSCKYLENNFIANHLVMQIIRSSTSAALNYGEAQAAESKRDFIHKTSIVLKELRETKICLKLLADSAVKAQYLKEINNCQTECDQLIAIFYKTVQSAKKNA